MPTTSTINIKEKQDIIRQNQIKSVFEKTTINKIEQYKETPLYLLNQVAINGEFVYHSDIVWKKKAFALTVLTEFEFPIPSCW